MSAAKQQPPAAPYADALDRATADLRTAAAEFRETAALLRTELATVRNERAEQADRISLLEQKVRDRDKAMKMLRKIAGIDPPPVALVTSNRTEVEPA